MELNADFVDGFSPLVEDEPKEDLVDVKAETDAKRRESERRLRSKKQQLRRFHDQICLRISDKQQQRRLEAQHQDKLLDDKFIKVLEATRPKGDLSKSSTSPARPATDFVEAQRKSESLKGSALGLQIEKVLRIDAHTRQLMLASMRLTLEHRHSDCDPNNQTSAPWDLESEETDDEETKPRNAAHKLLPKQRVALYATVRRRYMERERADARRPLGSSLPRPPLATGDAKPKFLVVSRAKSEPNEPRRQSGGGVKVVDMTLGCEVRLHKQVASSSTPWRKKGIPSASASSFSLSSAHKGGNQATRSRFLSALEIEMGTPALCSCSRNMASSPFYERPCANNCALYNAPREREKLLTSVYKQQQQQQQTGPRKSAFANSSPAC